jgi:hypothetical protein
MFDIDARVHARTRVPVDVDADADVNVISTKKRSTWELSVFSLHSLQKTLHTPWIHFHTVARKWRFRVRVWIRLVKRLRPL